jgi:hypothetical protein
LCHANNYIVCLLGKWYTPKEMNSGTVRMGENTDPKEEVTVKVYTMDTKHTLTDNSNLLARESLIKSSCDTLGRFLYDLTISFFVLTWLSSRTLPTPHDGKKVYSGLLRHLQDQDIKLWHTILSSRTYSAQTSSSRWYYCTRFPGWEY